MGADLARGPWQGLADVEPATLEYVDWFNHRRLHGEITNGPGYTTPAPSKPTTTVPLRSQPIRKRPKPPSVYEIRGASAHPSSDDSPSVVLSSTRSPYSTPVQTRLSRNVGAIMITNQRRTSSDRRISLFLPNLNGGGAERMSLVLAKQFQEQGYSVDLILAKRSGHLRSQVPRGIEVFDLKKRGALSAVGRLVRYLVRRQPIALISAMPTANAAAALACKIASTRTVAIISERSTRSVALGNVSHVRLRRRLYSGLLHISCRICYPLSDIIVCISPGVADEVAARYPKLSNRIRIIPNPANPQTPEHAPPSVSKDIHPWLDDPETACAVAVGRLVEQKDYPTLLAALSRVREQTDLHLIVVGYGPQRAELENLASRLSVDDAVDFVGFRHDRLEFIRRADVFVMTSKNEGFGNVLVEALSVGAHIVATDCRTGPRLILLNGELGYLVPVGDAGAVATALERALTDPLADLPAKRRRASDFSPNMIAERYLDEIKRVL